MCLEKTHQERPFWGCCAWGVTWVMGWLLTKLKQASCWGNHIMKNNYYLILLIDLGLIHIGCGLVFLLLGSTYSNLHGTTKKYAKIKQKKKKKKKTPHTDYIMLYLKLHGSLGLLGNDKIHIFQTSICSS